MTKQQDDPIVRGEVTRQWWLGATLVALKKSVEEKLFEISLATFER